MRKLVIALFLIVNFGSLLAQDVEVNVTIDNQQATDIPKALIEDLKQTIQNFVNNRRWTNDNFEPFERVKYNLAITLAKGAVIGSYPCKATIQMVRPIYGSTYESISFMFLDTDFNIEYQNGITLQYNENNFDSNLTSLLAFYTYVVLAVDYDSFSKLGGTQFVEKAFNIAGIAQQNGIKGWETGDFNNKWSLINQLNNQQFIPFREMLFTYHYQAMDTFLKDRATAQKVIYDGLKKLEPIQTFYSNSIVLKSFFIAKHQEIISIFNSAPSNLKADVVKLLTKLDLSNSDKYRVLSR